MYGFLLHNETDSYKTFPQSKKRYFYALLSLSYRYFVTQTVMNGGKSQYATDTLHMLALPTGNK